DAHSLEARVNAMIDQASANRYDGPGRPPPALRSTGDGGYSYRGEGWFWARIRPDGSVQMPDFPAPSAETSEGSAGIRFAGLTDRWMQANGVDPYGAERRWFLEQTRGIRERLEDRHRARLVHRALRRLRGRLEALWNEPAAPGVLRSRIAALWSECADDEAGRRARELIEAFVRERLVEGTPEAMTIEALRAGERRSEPARAREPALPPSE
ncbi:MAG: hypothetical protein OEY14_14435, partial [Myxococcales bacterium]|nr:hypothetical protein [Myxococcales bacterium]